MDENLNGEFILENSNQPQEDTKPKTGSQKTALNSPHFYSAFTDRPKGVTFIEQETGEEVLLLLRRHFATNIPWLFASIILIALPVFFPAAAATFPLPEFSSITLLLLLLFYYLFIFGFLLLNFTLWYFHVGLVTNLKVIDIDLAGILYRHIAVAKHENIEDVSQSQVGFISSLFNYGNVYVQTAGSQQNIDYDRVPHPARVADVISDLANAT